MFPRAAVERVNRLYASSLIFAHGVVDVDFSSQLPRESFRVLDSFRGVLDAANTLVRPVDQRNILRH